MFISDILIRKRDGQEAFVGAGYLYQVYHPGSGKSGLELMKALLKEAFEEKGAKEKMVG